MYTFCVTLFGYNYLIFTNDCGWRQQFFSHMAGPRCALARVGSQYSQVNIDSCPSSIH